MAHIWKKFVDAMTEDDLLIRVLLAAFGAGAATLGYLAGSEAVDAKESWGWLLALWLVGLLFLAWGVLLFGAAFTRPSSRWSKVAERFYPNPSGLDEAAFLLVFLLIPAILLTLILKSCGLRGHGA